MTTIVTQNMDGCDGWDEYGRMEKTDQQQQQQ